MKIDKSYKVGDTVRYETFTGELRALKVTEKHDDIKNARPGFCGYEAKGMFKANYWGYNSQILRVFCQEKSRWK